MMNKRGQELSTNTIIIIILAVVVLVVLAIGFSMGWTKIAPWLSTNNIDNIKTSCAAACSTGSQFEFCSSEREVKDGTNDAFKSTCNNLSSDAKYSGYAIAKCPSVKCSA